MGAAGFIGSHLTEGLLAHGVQVVGVDDFSTGRNENLTECVKDKNFHLIRGSITESLDIELPRLDYAFFVINSSLPGQLYRTAFNNFLKVCKELKTKIVLVSSIDLYSNRRIEELSNLRQVEERLAHYSLENKANARVVRLSALFGPRMNFEVDDPICRLIQSNALGELQKEAAPLDFTTRSIFVDDAVDLLIKAVMHGATAQKIYDGVRLNPIKVTEIKQVLLDPLWHERRGFTPTELPPWPTPNIAKTMRELSWGPKTSIVTALKKTVTFFKDNPDLILKKAPYHAVQDKEQEADRVEEESKDTPTKNHRDILKRPAKDFKKIFVVFKRYTTFWAVVMLVVMAFFYPVASVAIDAVSIRDHLILSSEAISKGDFQVAENEVHLAKNRAGSIKQMVGSLDFLKFTGILNPYLDKAEQLTNLADEITDAAEHSVRGTQALSFGIKAVSGETEGDGSKFFETAGFELDQADRQLALAFNRLSDDGQLKDFKKNLGDFLSNFRQDVGRGRIAVSFLTQAIPKEGRKNYLVLLQDNTNLRPSGGTVVAYAEVVFENGKLLEVKTDSIDNFEAGVKEPVDPPAEIKNDLGKSSWSLRDYGFNADFPANARLAQWFYRRSTQTNPAGVIALDLTAASTLVASGTKQESVDLAEVVNQVFFLSKQNWTDTGRALYLAAREKHLMVYMSDPLFFSFLTTQGWVGVVPEEGREKVGEREGFLAFSEANIGNGYPNQTLKRSFNLESNIDKAGWVSHKLTVAYSNAGIYKARLKVYLPAGTKLVKAIWGNNEITKEVKSFSDYGRTGYSMVLELKPKEEKELKLEYQDAKSLSWEANTAKYKLQVIKQPGTSADKFDFKLVFPPSWQANSTQESTGQLSFLTDFSQDRSFEIVLKK